MIKSKHSVVCLELSQSSSHVEPFETQIVCGTQSPNSKHTSCSRQLSPTSQIGSSRVSPNLIRFHLRVLVKLQDISKHLVPALSRLFVGEDCLSPHRHLAHLCIHNVIGKPHVLVTQLLPNGLEVVQKSVFALVFAAQKGRQARQTVLEDYDVIAVLGEVLAKDLGGRRLGGEGGAKGFRGFEEGLPRDGRH